MEHNVLSVLCQHSETDFNLSEGLKHTGLILSAVFKRFSTGRSCIAFLTNSSPSTSFLCRIALGVTPSLIAQTVGQRMAFCSILSLLCRISCCSILARQCASDTLCPTMAVETAVVIRKG